ncbi:MAG: class I SAM-dependent RNA methyltransferase [Syntrophaceae bacterium]|nr:class I SAM-dependent RNA methyltransferase [Syntrophaceae bacterium]
MQIKDIAKVKIDSAAFGGEGVGRLDNIVVFVPFSAPGDELEIEITQVKKKFVRGRIFKVIKESPFRVKSLCLYYEKCGGCCYQHLDYEYQLKIKKKQVEDTFRRIGKIANPLVWDTMASPKIYHYRGKAQYHAKDTSRGWEIGFMDVSGGRLINIEHCKIMEETINEQMRALKENKRLKSKTNGQLTVWSNSLPEKKKKEESIIRIVKGKNFLVPRGGFFQANLYLTDKLVDEVCRLASVNKVNTLVDAYCGSGLFSLFLSSLAENIIGIDINEKSVKHARINAKNLSVKNAEFIRGDIENVLKERFLLQDNRANVIVLDPPRVGCKKAVLKAIMDLQPERIIYISCNPATQARDIKFLKEYGYNLKSLLPMDMFPQTEHIEVVGLLERK